MSHLVSRILLAILMFPLAAVFYCIVVVVGERWFVGYGYPGRDNAELLAADGLTWPFIAVYWFLLWRSSVNWSSGRIVGTLLATGSAATAGVLTGFAGTTTTGRADKSFWIFAGGVFAMLLWLAATVFIWRETPAERAERIKGSSKSAVTCPTCGYNLTGLSEARCPECGTRFTLDELLALPPGADKDIE